MGRGLHKKHENTRTKFPPKQTRSILFQSCCGCCKSTFRFEGRFPALFYRFLIPPPCPFVGAPPPWLGSGAHGPEQYPELIDLRTIFIRFPVGICAFNHSFFPRCHSLVHRVGCSGPPGRHMAAHLRLSQGLHPAGRPATRRGGLFLQKFIFDPIALKKLQTQFSLVCSIFFGRIFNFFFHFVVPTPTIHSEEV